MRMTTLCCLALVVSSGCGEDLVEPMNEAAVPSSNGAERQGSRAAADGLRDLQQQAIEGLNRRFEVNEETLQSVETGLEQVRGDVAENRRGIENIQSTLDEMRTQSDPEPSPARSTESPLQQLAVQAAQSQMRIQEIRADGAAAAEILAAFQPDNSETETLREQNTELRVRNAALEQDAWHRAVDAGRARVEAYRLQEELRASQWRERAASTHICDPQWSGRVFAGHRW